MGYVGGLQREGIEYLGDPTNNVSIAWLELQTCIFNLRDGENGKCIYSYIYLLLDISEMS